MADYDRDFEKIFQRLDADERRAVHQALAQWADNERIGLEESDLPDPKHEEQVSLVEGVVDRLNAAVAALVRDE